jgi:hypothetical protein
MRLPVPSSSASSSPGLLHRFSLMWIRPRTIIFAKLAGGESQVDIVCIENVQVWHVRDVETGVSEPAIVRLAGSQLSLNEHGTAGQGEKKMSTLSPSSYDIAFQSLKSGKDHPDPALRRRPCLAALSIYGPKPWLGGVGTLIVAVVLVVLPGDEFNEEKSRLSNHSPSHNTGHCRFGVNCISTQLDSRPK